MTLREYMAKNRPETINNDDDGGVIDCPDCYDELDGHYKQLCCTVDGSCDKCWGQEYIDVMPQTEKQSCDGCEKCAAYCANCNRHLLGNNDVYASRRTV